MGDIQWRREAREREEEAKTQRVGQKGGGQEVGSYTLSRGSGRKACKDRQK